MFPGSLSTLCEFQGHAPPARAVQARAAAFLHLGALGTLEHAPKRPILEPREGGGLVQGLPARQRQSFTWVCLHHAVSAHHPPLLPDTKPERPPAFSRSGPNISATSSDLMQATLSTLTLFPCLCLSRCLYYPNSDFLPCRSKAAHLISVSGVLLSRCVGGLGGPQPLPPSCALSHHGPRTPKSKCPDLLPSSEMVPVLFPPG